MSRVNSDGEVSVDALALEFETSEVTIRKDLTALEKSGLLLSIPLAFWSIDYCLHSFKDRVTQPIRVYHPATIVVTVITKLIVTASAFKATTSNLATILNEE